MKCLLNVNNKNYIYKKYFERITYLVRSQSSYWSSGQQQHQNKQYSIEYNTTTSKTLHMTYGMLLLVLTTTIAIVMMMIDDDNTLYWTMMLNYYDDDCYASGGSDDDQWQLKIMMITSSVVIVYLRSLFDMNVNQQ